MRKTLNHLFGNLVLKVVGHVQSGLSVSSLPLTGKDLMLYEMPLIEVIILSLGLNEKITSHLLMLNGKSVLTLALLKKTFARLNCNLT